MIKKTQIEIIIFILLLILILFTNNIDSNIYKYFSQLNYGVGTPYLKVFFVKITELGDSLWYFLILIFLFLISLLLNRINVVSGKNYSYLRNMNLPYF